MAIMSELDVLLALASESYDSNGCPAAILQKISEINCSVSVAIRKTITTPILQSNDRQKMLCVKIDEYFSRRNLKRGVFHGQ